ncbi:MAG TPA: hypothetical protein VFF30_20270 [Nitrososphaerales archaeon]|nr:hypothetical protein [Nitrososphaerales archaeon]
MQKGIAIFGGIIVLVGIGFMIYDYMLNSTFLGPLRLNPYFAIGAVVSLVGVTTITIGTTMLSAQNMPDTYSLKLRVVALEQALKKRGIPIPGDED